MDSLVQTSYYTTTPPPVFVFLHSRAVSARPEGLPSLQPCRSDRRSHRLRGRSAAPARGDTRLAEQPRNCRVAPAGVDLEQSRGQEEQQMLQDARQWLNSGRIEDTRQARSGATALHVAAAKGYSEVLRCGVCQRGVGGRVAWLAGLQGCQPRSVLCVVLRCGSACSVYGGLPAAARWFLADLRGQGPPSPLQPPL